MEFLNYSQHSDLMTDTEIELMMEELYEAEAFSCGTSAEEAEAILDEMEEPELEPEPEPIIYHQGRRPSAEPKPEPEPFASWNRIIFWSRKFDLDNDAMTTACLEIIRLFNTAPDSETEPETRPAQLQSNLDRITGVTFSSCSAVAGDLLLHGRTKPVHELVKGYKLQVSDQGLTKGGTFCSCADFFYRSQNSKHVCKHLAALALRWLTQNAS